MFNNLSKRDVDRIKSGDIAFLKKILIEERESLRGSLESSRDEVALRILQGKAQQTKAIIELLP